MATLAALPSAVPGLGRTLDIAYLRKGREAYNNLPDDSEQPAVMEEHIQRLAELFVLHNAHHTLGVHLIHGHFKTPEDTIMLGSNFEHPRGRWTKATDIHAVELNSIHGHIFVLTSDGFITYEYQDGALPDLSGVRKEFLAEFVDYLVTNGLTELLGLQILVEGMDCSMWELILDQGTVMLDATAVRGCSSSRTTSWQFELRDGQPRVCATKEVHA